MSDKDNIKSINNKKKSKQWYIKTDSSLLIYWLFTSDLLFDLLMFSLS